VDFHGIYTNYFVEMNRINCCYYFEVAIILANDDLTFREV